MNDEDRVRAYELHEQAQALEGQDDDQALRLYHEALALDSRRPETLYNIGLIHKYRGEWGESREFNRCAVELDPGDEAANWNLAIAATALCDWRTAREVWHRLGMGIEPGDTPIDDDFGRALTRLEPEGSAEVVWGRRIDPVRLRIENVPLPGSGYRLGDVVLHDGASTGKRVSEGREYFVFNALMLHMPSRMTTFELEVEAASLEDLTALELAVETQGGYAEDWTARVRMLCKACSDGLPHEHDDAAAAGDKVWDPNRRIGIGAEDATALQAALEGWVAPGRRVLKLSAVLKPPALT
jgi:tetratricopeptide (TPR) repeat protein